MDRKPVIRVSRDGTQKVYKSLGEAAMENAMHYTTIAHAASRTQRHFSCGYLWFFADDAEKIDTKLFSTNMFDIVETHENCTVQIIKNSVTGEQRICWWENDNPPIGVDADA